MAGATGSGRRGLFRPDALNSGVGVASSAFRFSRPTDGSFLTSVSLPVPPVVLGPLAVLCLTVFVCFGLETSLSMQTALLRDSIDRDLAASVALERIDSRLLEARSAFDLPHRVAVADPAARQRMQEALAGLSQLRQELPTGTALRERDADFGRITTALERTVVRMRRVLDAGAADRNLAALTTEMNAADPDMADPVRADPVTADQARRELQALSQMTGAHRAAIIGRARAQAQQAVAVGARAEQFALAGLTLIICLAVAATMFVLSEIRRNTSAATLNGFRLGRVRRCGDDRSRDDRFEEHTATGAAETACTDRPG